MFLCSDADFELLGSPASAVVVPNGQAFEMENPPTYEVTGPPVIAFWGALTYGPNADGAKWFIDDVLPLVLAARPELRMKVIGRGGDRLTSLPPQVQVMGFAEDLGAALTDVAVAVVPLRMGGGTRIKVVEAWARGIPVVSTSLGVYGLSARHDDDVVCADDAAAFAEAILTLLADVGLRERLIASGLAKAANLTWTNVEEKVFAAVRSAANAGL